MAKRFVMIALWAVLWFPFAAQAQEPLNEGEDVVAGWGIPATTLEDVAQQWPTLQGLTGPASYRFAIKGSPPVAFISVKSDAAALGTIELGKLNIEMTSELGTGRGLLTVTVDGPLAKDFSARFEVPVVETALVSGRVEVRDGVIKGGLKTTGLLLDKITEQFPLLAATGQVDLELDMAGKLSDAQMTIKLAGRELTWRGETVGEIQLDWAQKNNDARIALRWGPQKEPYATLDARLPLAIDLLGLDWTWIDRGQHELKLVATGLTPERLAPFWRAPSAAHFDLNFSAEGKGTLNNFKLTGALEGQLQDRQQAPLELVGTFSADPREQAINFSIGDGLLTAGAKTKIPVVAVRRANKPMESVPLTGGITLTLPLPTLGPYMPEGVYDPQGVFGGQLDLGGTLGKPEFTGQFGTEGVELTLVDLNQRLKDVDLSGTFHDTTIEITAFNARSGVGGISGTGQVVLDATPAGHDSSKGLWSDWKVTGGLEVLMERFPFIHDTFPNGIINGAMNVGMEAGPGDTAFKVQISKTNVKLLDVYMPSAAAIPTNRVVRVLDWSGEAQYSDSVFAGQGHLNVDFELVDPIHVKGAGTDMKLVGQMIVDRQDTIAKVLGGFKALPGGTFDLFENQFTVRSGTLTLMSGDLADRGELDLSQEGPATTGGLRDPNKPPEAVPLEPVMEFVAYGVAVDTHVLVKVRGPGRKPELVLVSNPPLPEYQILTLLITGRVDAVDDSNGEVRRKVASLVNRFHNPSLDRQLYDRIGVDKLGLGFGSNVTEPILTVGKQIDRQLYVETIYHHNAPPEENEKEGRAEYRLSPWWTFDTIYGDAGNGRVGLFWQSRFGGPPPPVVPDGWGTNSDDGESEAAPPSDP